MRKVAPVLLLRLALLIAVLGCSVLLVEYENMGDPAFCGAGSGCMAVRHSAYASIAGVHLPFIGLVLELMLFALSLVARDRDNTFFVAAAAAGGGLIAVGLIGIMTLKLGVVCKWCMLVDLSTLVAAGAAAWVHFEIVRDPSYADFLAALSLRRVQVIAWIAGAALMVGVPYLWGEFPVVPAPPTQIAALAVPGKITVVAFTDFECPFCRKLAPVLEEVRDNWGERSVLVRKMAPLSFHAGAMPAALAYVCTPLDLRDEMAKKLYAAPEAMLNPEGVEAMARTLHVDEDRFSRCLADPATRAQVDADKKLFDDLELHGLPYSYVDKRAVAGFNPDALRKIGREAMEGDRPSLPLWGMVAAALVVAAGLAALTLRLAPRDEAPVVAPSA
jgi:uncharacterized membrane protein/predicted DsbA family dithiol-disulfide isomerase